MSSFYLAKCDMTTFAFLLELPPSLMVLIACGKRNRGQDTDVHISLKCILGLRVRAGNKSCLCFAEGKQGEVRILLGNQRQNHSSFHVALISTIEDMGREKNPSYEMRQGGQRIRTLHWQDEEVRRQNTSLFNIH